MLILSREAGQGVCVGERYEILVGRIRRTKARDGCTRRVTLHLRDREKPGEAATSVTLGVGGTLMLVGMGSVVVTDFEYTKRIRLGFEVARSVPIRRDEMAA